MKKYDCFILLFMLIFTLVSTIGYVLFKTYTSDEDLLTATISQHGQVIQTICLSQVSSPYELTFQDGHGGINKVEVSKNHIRMIESNCPDQICVKHGPIHPNEPPAVCLPHELIIEVHSSKKESSQPEASSLLDALSQ